MPGAVAGVGVPRGGRGVADGGGAGVPAGRGAAGQWRHAVRSGAHQRAQRLLAGDADRGALRRRARRRQPGRAHRHRAQPDGRQPDGDPRRGHPPADRALRRGRRQRAARRRRPPGAVPATGGAARGRPPLHHRDQEDAARGGRHGAPGAGRLRRAGRRHPHRSRAPRGAAAALRRAVRRADHRRPGHRPAPAGVGVHHRRRRRAAPRSAGDQRRRGDVPGGRWRQPRAARHRGRAGSAPRARASRRVHLRRAQRPRRERAPARRRRQPRGPRHHAGPRHRAGAELRHRRRAGADHRVRSRLLRRHRGDRRRLPAELRDPLVPHHHRHRLARHGAARLGRRADRARQPRSRDRLRRAHRAGHDRRRGAGGAGVDAARRSDPGRQHRRVGRRHQRRRDLLRHLPGPHPRQHALRDRSHDEARGAERRRRQLEPALRALDQLGDAVVAVQGRVPRSAHADAAPADRADGPRRDRSGALGAAHPRHHHRQAVLALRVDRGRPGHQPRHLSPGAHDGPVAGGARGRSAVGPAARHRRAHLGPGDRRRGSDAEAADHQPAQQRQQPGPRQRAPPRRGDGSDRSLPR